MENEIRLPDGSHSVLHIQDYFEYIGVKHEAVAHNPQIYIDIKWEMDPHLKLKYGIISKFLRLK